MAWRCWLDDARLCLCQSHARRAHAFVPFVLQQTRHVCVAASPACRFASVQHMHTLAQRTRIKQSAR